MDANREYSGKGMINDFVDNMMKICLQGFKKDELFGVEINQKEKADPDKVKVEDLPALFVWTDGFEGSNHSMGQMKEKELSEKIEIQLKIRYVTHKVDGEEKAEENRQVANLMWEHLVGNKNINDLSVATNIGKVDLSTNIMFVGGKLQPVDGFQIPITCTFQQRMKQSTRINDRYT